jgi:hypothetical protein
MERRCRVKKEIVFSSFLTKGLAGRRTKHNHRRDSRKTEIALEESVSLEQAILWQCAKATPTTMG